VPGVPSEFHPPGLNRLKIGNGFPSLSAREGTEMQIAHKRYSDFGKLRSFVSPLSKEVERRGNRALSASISTSPPPQVTGLGYVPLEPTAFLRRSARVFGDRVAVIDDDATFTYAEFAERVDRMAGMLGALGIRPGDRVAVLAPNTHVMLALHYAVPLAGAVIVALNTRLSPGELAVIVGHSGAELLIYDYELEAVALELIRLEGRAIRCIRCGDAGSELETLLGTATSNGQPPQDELAMIALNYTSGTTGKPKGVMYSHRGAYLQALAMAFHTQLDSDSVYLWTLPMFHCCGWCFTWAVTAAGATHRCLRKPDAALIWQHLRESRISHLCAAPTVLVMLANHEAARAGKPARPVRIYTGGAPPSPALLQRTAELDIDVFHLYGLTETYGPAVVCEWRAEWNALTIPAQAELKARQGVGNIVTQEARVVDFDGRDVSADGIAQGEIALRGNNVMLGYYHDPEATAAAVPDGWFRTGDIGVMYPDRYIQLTDRSKDVIISGGENIASVEVEQMLERHPDVMEVAVVAGPDPTWGEVPIAFVTLRPGASADEAMLVAYAREHIARFKAPKRIVFGELPKTGTGKIQKFVLRDRAKALLGATK
jgi:fatty-acyl-CoA synthase